MHHPGISHPSVGQRFGRWVTIELLRVPLVLAISIPFALWLGPAAGMASWILLVPVTALIHLRFRDRVRSMPDD